MTLYISNSLAQISQALHSLTHEHNQTEFNIPDILLDALIDSAKMLPFLFIAFLLMEYLEHKAGDKLVSFLSKTSTGSIGGSFAGALLGCIPQCGFSVAASNLFSGKMITMGTLIAVFLSTSDEAIPILLAHPESASLIWKVIIAKIIIAVISGLLIDFIIRVMKLQKKEEPFQEICHDCGCEDKGIWYSSIKHTINIFVFILIVNIVLGLIIGYAGIGAVEGFLESMGPFQPLLAGLVGMIPNCAASVLITELLAEGAITFGSAVAGLCTGAGVGLVVLFRTNKNIKENLIITGLLYLTGTLSGIIINIFM